MCPSGGESTLQLLKVLPAHRGCPCELTKILPDEVNFGRKLFESLPRSDEVGIFCGDFQLLRRFLCPRGLKCSNRALQCVSCPLDHYRVARIKAASDLAFL